MLIHFNLRVSGAEAKFRKKCGAALSFNCLMCGKFGEKCGEYLNNVRRIFTEQANSNKNLLACRRLN